MINHENIRTTIVKGLRKYLGCPIVQSNQNADMPKHPYVQYTVTNPKGENKGTYSEWSDQKARKERTQTWSITAISDDDLESVTLADKAHEWLDYVGTTYLNDNDVIIQSVTMVVNRDNVLTTDYEYRNGFDCVINCTDEIDLYGDTAESIESVTINDEAVQKGGDN